MQVMKNQKLKPMNKIMPEAKVKSLPKPRPHLPKPALLRPGPIVLPKLKLPSLLNLHSSKPKRNGASKKFTPPTKLTDGFTPFFKESKYFDEKSYFQNITTSEPTKSTTSPTKPMMKKVRMPVKKYQPTIQSYKQKPFSKDVKPTMKLKQVYQQQDSMVRKTTELPFIAEHWDTFEKDFPKFEIQKKKTSTLSWDSKSHKTTPPMYQYKYKSPTMKGKFRNFPAVIKEDNDTNMKVHQYFVTVHILS